MAKIQHVLHWISVCFIQKYVGYVKFALKSMDTVHMGHVHVGSFSVEFNENS